MIALDRLKGPLRGTIVHRAYRTARDLWDEFRPVSDISLLNNQYDRQTLRVMRRVLQRDSICVDVGAHDGALLATMIELAPDASHHAVEPLPHLAEHLRTTFPTARVHQCAVGDETGTSTFQYVENDPGYSGLRPRIYDRPDPIVRQLTVQVARMDDFVPSTERVAFIKIDVEGGEYHVLRGATETIRRGKPVIVFEAGQKSTGQYGVTAQDMYALVTDTLGYELSTMRRWLMGAPPLSAKAYHWGEGADFYFIAYPKR